MLRKLGTVKISAVEATPVVWNGRLLRFEWSRNSEWGRPGRYVMAIEIGGDDPIVGKPFTCVFAESKDLIAWTLPDTMDYSYSGDRYTACPCLRYYGGHFYIICLESAPFHRWIPYIARSRDLRDFELGEVHSVMWFDNDDKGKEFLVLAEYDGTQEEFVKSFFAD